jgi:signal transduction histidine kinase
MKHGRPKRIEIRLQREGSNIELLIRDDGAGFAASRGEGLGLRIMRYRADSVGGVLTVHSKAGEGTSVRCLVAERPAPAVKPISNPS